MTIRPGSLQAWRVALRPPSLVVALSPVLVGAALAWAERGAPDPVVLALVLLAAVLMQTITNLQNDVGFTQRGGDAVAGRTGLPRATAQGWLAVAQVRTVIALASTIATALGLALAQLRGWPVLVIGGASLAAALGYMGGARPIAYTPAGELTVFVFFGLVAVLGSQWMLAGTVSLAGAVAAAAIGGLASAALAANNYRDLDHDRAIGRRTFAVAFGATVARRLYGATLALPFAATGVMAIAAHRPTWGLTLLLSPLALRLWRDACRQSRGPGFNPIVQRSFALLIGFALLLSLAIVIG